MELWPIPYLTVTAFLFAFFAAALRGLFGEARDVESSVGLAVDEAKRGTAQDLTDLMSEEMEQATPPLWVVDPLALGAAIREARERKARRATEKQWRRAMTCSRLLDRVGSLKALESTGRFFCLTGLITLVAYALLILFWLPDRSHLLIVVTILMWGAPVIAVVGIRVICEVVGRRIGSVQEEMEEPWRV